jgi:ATP-dependent DNA ligase
MSMDARFKPMLCEVAEELPVDPAGWVLEPKFDGWRCVIATEGAADAEIVNGPLAGGLYGGRNGSDYTGQVPYIEDAVSSVVPPGTVLDGELVSVSNTSGGVQSIMAASGAHVPSPLLPALTFVAFDVLFVNDQDVRGLPWKNRRQVLEMIEWPEHTKLTPLGPATKEAHVAMLDAGMEGSVIKQRESVYFTGRRSSAWMKLKAIATDDAIIVGFEEGENGRSGEVGAIVVELPNGVQTTASGMTDKVRADMLARPANYVGKTVEIAHNGFFPSGKVRHPRYKRMRDDLTPKPEPKPADAKPTRPRGKSMSNDGAMGTSKLRDCLSELEGQYGDAYQRVQAGRYQGDVSDHLRACREAARAKGVL